MSKTVQRKIIKQRLNEVDEQYFVQANEKIAKKFLSLIAHEKLNLVLSYMPLKKEASTIFINNYLLEKGVKVAFPKVVGDNIEFYTTKEFVAGSYNILEPINGAIKVDGKKADIIIVPLVGFDKNKNRLGHGKGYYDRFLENKNIKTIGLAYEIQRLDEITVLKNDIGLDVVVTEEYIY